jgi:putative SOS response-associated peptidase YedK
VLPRELWADWLSPDVTTAEAVQPMLDFSEPGRFAAHPVPTAVNGSRNSGPELVLPVPADQLVGVVDPQTGEVVGRAG